MMTSLTAMRPIFSMTKSGNFQLGLMMFLFCFANLLLITASQQLDSNSHLGDGNVDANSIASDLKSGNRGVFAVGYVSDKLTLFVSGPGSGNHKNPSGGFQVAVDEATDGVFKISSVPVPVPSGIPSDAGVKFVCKDSSGDNLVAMSNNEIGTSLLPSGSYERTKITGTNIPGCYHDASFHLSSNEDDQFYAHDPETEYFRKFSFDNKSIKVSVLCNTDYTFGQLCINEESISFKDKCDGIVLSGISGSVGSSNAYLFDDSNTVYVFEATVFTSKQPAKLTKKSKEEAFEGKVEPSTAAVPQETTSQSKVLLFSVIFIVVTIVLAILIPLICCYCKPFAELWQKKKSKNPRSSQKSTRKGGTSGRHVKGGSSRTSSPTKMATSSNRNKSKSKSKSKAASPQSKQS